METVEYLKAQDATRVANQLEIEDDNIEVHRGIDSDLFSRTSRSSLSRLSFGITSGTNTRQKYGSLEMVQVNIPKQILRPSLGSYTPVPQQFDKKSSGSLKSEVDAHNDVTESLIDKNDPINSSDD